MPQDTKPNDFEPTIQLQPHAKNQTPHEPSPEPHQAQASPKETPASSKKISYKLILLITCLALFSALAAAWISLTTQDKVQQFEQQSNLALPQTLAELALLQQQLDHLGQELNQLQKQQTQTSTQQQSILQNQNQKKQALRKPTSSAPKTPLVQKKVVNQAKKIPQRKLKPHSKANWQVVIASYQDPSKAKKQQQQLKNISTLIQPVIIRSHTWYRLLTTSFNTKQQAKKFAFQLKQQGIQDAWVTQKSTQ